MNVLIALLESKKKELEVFWILKPYIETLKLKQC